MQAIVTYAEKRMVGSTPEFFNGEKVITDSKLGLSVVKIMSGDWYVSTQPGEMLTTILGSCVSACIRDPQSGIGGMNHFLLPGDENMITELSDAARYGVFAMERLINGIISFGGRKERLEIKVFGGGNVINNSAKIGSKNAEFIRQYLKDEGLRINCQDLEGNQPRRVHYFPDTGKVLIRRLQRREDMAIIAEEARYSRGMAGKSVEGAVNLF